MRALLLFVLLLFISLLLPAQIRLHQIENLPVQNHEAGKEYQQGDVVKTSSGLLFRATTTTTTTPPGVAWEGFAVGGGAADGDGFLDGGTDTIPNIAGGGSFLYYLFPNATPNTNNRLIFGSELNANAFRTGWQSQAADNSGFTFRHEVDSLGNLTTGGVFMAFTNGSTTGRYSYDRLTFSGSVAPFGMNLVATSSGFQFNAPTFGGTYIAMPFAGPGASANGRVRVTDGAGATTWQDYTPASSIVNSIVAGSNITVDDTDPNNPVVSATGDGTGTDDQTLTLNGTDLSIEGGNTVDLSTVQDGVIDSDADATNELQILSYNEQTGVLTLSGGNSVTLSAASGVTTEGNIITTEFTPSSYGLVETGWARTYRGVHYRTYFAWFALPNSEVKVAYYDHDTKEFSQIFNWGIPRANADDNHAAPAITITPNGYIIVFQEQLQSATVHNSSMHIRRSTSPEDPSSWAAISGSPFSDNLSYTHLNYLKDGKMIFYARNFPSQIKSWISNDDGLTWTEFDGSAIGTGSTPAVVNLEDGMWAYHNTFQLDDGVGLTVFPRTGSTGNYPLTYAIFTFDGITYGNWEWYLSKGGSGWSKDVTGTPISKVDLRNNCVVVGDTATDNNNVRNYAPRMYVKGKYMALTNDKRTTSNGATDTRFIVMDSTATLISDFTITNNNPYTGLDIGLPSILPINPKVGHYEVFVRVSDGRVVRMQTMDGGRNFTHLENLYTGGAVDNERALYQYIDPTWRVFCLGWPDSDGKMNILLSQLDDQVASPGQTQIIAGGGGTDDQVLSISNDTIFLEDGGFIVLPESGGGGSTAGPSTTSLSFATGTANVTESSADLSGLTTRQDGVTILDRGFLVSTDNTVNFSDPVVKDTPGTGAFTVSATGLAASTDYFALAYAITEVDTSYSQETLQFTTLAGGGFLPTDLAGLELWLDGSDVDGDGIEEGTSEADLSGPSFVVDHWRDKSGNNHDFTRITGAPTLELISGTKYAVAQNSTGYFDSDDAASTWNFLHANDVTVFVRYEMDDIDNGVNEMFFSNIVSSTTSIGVQVGPWDGGGSVAADRDIVFYNSNGSGSRYYLLSQNTTNLTTQSNTYYTLTYTTDNSAALANKVYLEIDGVAASTQYTQGSGSASGSNATSTLRLMNAMSGSQPLTGSISDIIMYNRVLTAQEIDDVQAYLNTKYQ